MAPKKVLVHVYFVLVRYTKTQASFYTRKS